MSDVLVKGMDMPKSCDECPLFFKYYSKLEDKIVFHCKGQLPGESRFVDDFDWHTKPTEGCPLVEVPEQGRLIEAEV